MRPYAVQLAWLQQRHCVAYRYDGSGAGPLSAGACRFVQERCRSVQVARGGGGGGGGVVRVARLAVVSVPRGLARHVDKIESRPAGAQRQRQS